MSDNGTAQRQDVTPLGRGRSLVFAERRKQGRSLVRPPADFVAQLIACDQHLGEFRRANREDPAAGLRHYRTRETAPAPAFELQV